MSDDDIRDGLRRTAASACELAESINLEVLDNPAGRAHVFGAFKRLAMAFRRDQEEIRKLLGLMLTCSQENTVEWMELLVERINEAALIYGDVDDVYVYDKRFGDIKAAKK